MRVSQVCFLGTGQYAISFPDRLDVRAFGEGIERSWQVGPLASMAMVGDELWLVTAGTPRLLRWQPGEDEPSACRSGSVSWTGAGAGALVSSPLWRTAAAWNGTQTLMITASPTSARSEIVERTDLVVPLLPSMWLHVTGELLQLRRGHVGVWQRRVEDVVAVRHACALFDGRSIGILARMRDGNHRLLVLGARDGYPQQSLAVRGLVTAELIPALGQIVLGLEERIVVLDLRFGTILSEWTSSSPPVSIAASADGTRVVLGLHDAVEEVVVAAHRPVRAMRSDEVAEQAPIVGERAEPADEPRPHSISEPPVSIAPAVDEPEPMPTEALAGLWPTRASERATTDEAALVLERHIEYLAAMVVRAIAEAWDTGRLNRANDEQPYLTEILGILGVASARAPALLAAADERVTASHERLIAAVHSLGTRQAPLTRLAAEFDLAPLATQVLMVIAAPLLHGELARLYGILASDPARPLVDELLVFQVLKSRASRSDIMRELDRDAPLQRFGLVHHGRGGHRPFRPLTPAPLVVRHLRDLPMASDVDSDLRAVTPTCPLEQLLVPRGALARCLRTLTRPPADGTPVRLVVRGRTGSGRRTVLAAIAARAGRSLGVIDASQHGRDPDARLEALESALVDAMLRGWLPCVIGLDDVGSDDHKLRAALAGLFRRHPGPLALHLSWSDQPPLAPGYVLLDLPPLLESERASAWRITLARHRFETDQVLELASRYRIGPGTIERVTSSVAGRVPVDDPGGELDREIRQHLEVRLGQLAQRVERLPSWADVVLPADVKDSLLELIARIRQRRRVFEEWGFDRKMTSSRGVTALFQGGPGTGKTMVAGVIARELGLDLYRIDLSRVVSKWIGETERNLATVFDAAEEGQCILLFDEADSLFARRTEVRSSNDRYANLEVNFLLQRLDSFAGIALLTTNFSGSIDRAFKRRLSLRLTFPFPDEELREQLWRSHLPVQLPREGPLDLATLARKFAMSGGYIRNAVLRAAFLAAEEGRALGQQHLERAVRLEFQEIGKLSESGTLE